MEQIAQIAQIEQEVLGNTKTKTTTITKKRKELKGRKWIFTLNNYTDLEYRTIEQHFQDTTYYCVGKEVGEEGTPHLQGYLEYKHAKAFGAIKKLIPRAHIEKGKGSRYQNLTYCSKEGDFITNIEMKISKDELIKKRRKALKDKAFAQEYPPNIVWKPWQKEVIEIIKNKPDKRSINWYWENRGNVGKSYLCKYLAIKYNVIICEGKKDNIFNQVMSCIDGGKEPTIILCDIPRTQQDYMNYGAIEQLKNGMLYSGKYEGGQAIFPIPHIICFSNAEPDMSKMSSDRWVIKRIQ